MNYSWSTPLRRNGQTDLPLIPNEIYLHIFECIAPIDRPLSQYFDQDIKIFSALALVCRFFRFVALPRIFEGVTFSAKKHRDSTLASRKSEWATQILANDEPAMSLALYVRECTFDTLALHEEEKWPFENLYCQAMARMSNIRKVVFSCLFVKIDHWEALAGLKQLDSLHLDSCSFIDDPPDKELTVRFVWLSYPSTTFTLRPVATTSLRSLKANDVEVVLKIVAFRQLAIESLFLDQQLSDIEPLLQVFQHLPSLLGVRFQIEGQALASSYSKLSLKKLFTRLLSFTIYVIDVGVTHYYTDDTKMSMWWIWDPS
ncbi:hypothetical protein EDD22DRAFT_947571 [Suillus occidentalis]|nr:hypothetical protein EDD22DRAFT_947571 [Suillus occidentalis]